MAKKKNGLAEITSSVFAMVIYIIWRDKNKIRFQKGRGEAEKMIREVVLHTHIMGRSRERWQLALQQLRHFP